jgi:hypothetical protein
MLTALAENTLTTGVVNRQGYSYSNRRKVSVLQNTELHTSFWQKRCRASPPAKRVRGLGIRVTPVPKR